MWLLIWFHSSCRSSTSCEDLLCNSFSSFFKIEDTNFPAYWNYTINLLVIRYTRLMFDITNRIEFSSNRGTTTASQATTNKIHHLCVLLQFSAFLHKIKIFLVPLFRSHSIFVQMNGESKAKKIPSILIPFSYNFSYIHIDIVNGKSGISDITKGETR
jgi:hypothetical protein